MKSKLKRNLIIAIVIIIMLTIITTFSAILTTNETITPISSVLRGEVLKNEEEANSAINPIAVTNNAPKVTYEQIGGEIKIGEKTTISVTATDPDGDNIYRIRWYWDDGSKLRVTYTADKFEMSSTQTYPIPVTPTDEGVHILYVCAVDELNNQCDWWGVPYYFVKEYTNIKDTTPPVFTKLPPNVPSLELNQEITVTANDAESGIYYMAYNWSKAGSSAPAMSSYTKIATPANNTITIPVPKEIGSWVLRVVAVNSTYNYDTGAFLITSAYLYNYKIEDKIAPTVTLNGQSTMDVPLNGSFVDEGATVTDNYDQTRTIYSEDEVNTKVRGTYVLHYKTQDTSGNESNEVTRSVTVVGEEDTYELTAPEKTTYKYGEEIDIKGAKIVKTSKRGEVSNIPVTKEMFEGFSCNKLGPNTYKFKYENAEIDYNYTVEDYIKERKVTRTKTS